jgi:hypothetical protein
MVQPALLPTPTEANEQKVTTRARNSWWQLFFTKDSSPDSHEMREWQNRALWVGIALVLQSLNEIRHSLYMPYLMPYGSLIPPALMIGSFVALGMALRPPQGRRDSTAGSDPRPWQRLLLILILVTSLAGLAEFGYGLALCFLPPQFPNDGTALDTNAASLLLNGQNPYSASDFVSVARTFAILPEWTTPLRQGAFANRLDYPGDAELQGAFTAALKTGQAPEFEGHVSYPALSFLTLVPIVLLYSNLHAVNVVPFYLLCYLLIVAIGWKVARPALRPWVLLLALANVPMWTSTTGANLDILCYLLLILAWLLRDRAWLSALMLGLAIATKQPAWFFTPLYVVMVWRLFSPREALRRLAMAGGVALAVNLPFIIWNPPAFLAGTLAPLIDPMFPLGVGLINLSTGHLLPYLPEHVYLALELAAMAAALLCYWRICRRYPEAAFLLAVIPLFFAWRSLPSYFYCAAFPLFLVQAAQRRSREPRKTKIDEQAPPLPALADSLLRPASREPLITGRAAFQQARPLPGLGSTQVSGALLPSPQRFQGLDARLTS